MDWLTDPLVLARFVHFAGCTLAAGTAVFAVLVAGREAAIDDLRRRWRRLITSSAAIAAVAGLIWLACVAAGILGTSVADAAVRGGLWSVAIDTQFGRLALARIALALLVVLPLWGDRIRAALTMGLVVLTAPAGHAGAQAGPLGWLHLGADAAHLAAAAAWLGGLPALVMVFGKARGEPAFGAMAVRATARFSWLGIVCVGALILTGAVNSWFLLSTPADLITTVYGRVLSSKLALFAAMVAIASVNRVRLSPRLPAATRALRRNSLVETAIGAAVLFLVAILGTLEPEGHHHAPGAVAAGDAFVHIHTNLAMADITVTPGRAGPVDVRIHLANEDFTDYAARTVRVALRPPEADGATVTVDATAVSGSVWDTGGIVLPRPGIWTIVMTITPRSGAVVVFDGPIVIAP